MCGDKERTTIETHLLLAAELLPFHATIARDCCDQYDRTVFMYNVSFVFYKGDFQTVRDARV